MAEAQLEHRLQSFRDALVGLDRLRDQDLTPGEQNSVKVVGELLQDEIERLSAEVEEQ